MSAMPTVSTDPSAQGADDAADANVLKLMQLEETKLQAAVHSAYTSLAHAAETQYAERACEDVNDAVRQLRALQLRLLPLLCPNPSNLPNPVLQRVLLLSGSHTRRVCKRFCDLHPSPPTRLRPRTGDSPAPFPPATLTRLPHATALDLTHLSRLPGAFTASSSSSTTAPRTTWHDTAIQILQRPTALTSLSIGLNGRYATYDPLPDALLTTLAHHHAPTLRTLSCNITTSTQIATVLRLTALRSLHMPRTTHLSPAAWEALQSLPLTHLDMGPLGETASDDGTFKGTHIIAAAAALPHLVDLRLPATMLWSTQHCAALSTMTRLRALRIGGCPMLFDCAHAARMLAHLTALTELQLVDPIWLPLTTRRPDGPIEALVSALRPLSFSLLFYSNVTGHTGGQHMPWDTALGHMASEWTFLTHLQLEGAHDDLVHSDEQREDEPPEAWLLCNAHLWLNKRILRRLAPTLRSLRLHRVLVPRDLFGLLGDRVPQLRSLAVEECAYRGGLYDLECGYEPLSGMYDESDLFPVNYVGLRKLAALTELKVVDHGDSMMGSVYGQHLELRYLKALQRLDMPDWVPDTADELWALLPLQKLRELTLGDVDQRYTNGAAIGLKGACAILRYLAGLTRLTCQAAGLFMCSFTADEVRRLGTAPPV